jgi:multidrug resistance efflux pump
MSPRSKRKLNWTRQIERYVTLARTDVVSRANYDESRFALEADKNKLQSLQQQANVQLAKLADAHIDVAQLPQYLQAKGASR